MHMRADSACTSYADKYVMIPKALDICRNRCINAYACMSKMYICIQIYMFVYILFIHVFV